MALAELLNSKNEEDQFENPPKTCQADTLAMRFFLINLHNRQGRFLLYSVLALEFLTACGGFSMRSSYDPTYEVIDRGGLDVLIRGRACAVEKQEAERLAQETAGFHLRSVVKGERYIPKFKTVRIYADGNRWCAEVAVRPQRLD